MDNFKRILHTYLNYITNFTENAAPAAEVMVIINFRKLKVLSQFVLQEVQSRSLFYISSK